MTHHPQLGRNDSANKSKPDSIQERTDSSDSEKENKCWSRSRISGHSTDCIPDKISPSVMKDEKLASSGQIGSADREYKLKSLSVGSLLKVKREDHYYTDQVKQEVESRDTDDEEEDEDLTGLKIVSSCSLFTYNYPYSNLSWAMMILYILLSASF